MSAMSYMLKDALLDTLLIEHIMVVQKGGR